MQIESTDTQSSPYRFVQVSVRGYYHEKNEDAYLHTGDFFGVADGVGGGAHGHVASQAVLRYCAGITDWQQPEYLRQQIIGADAHVTACLEAIDSQQGASAFAGCWLDQNGQGWLTWVGDVRAYLISPDAREERQQDGLLLKQLTEDHTFGNLGEVSPSGKPDNLARYVGFGRIGLPPLQPIQLKQGEYLLLMSDGIHRYVGYSKLLTLCQILNQPDSGVQQFAEALVEAAQQAKTHDDSTVLVLGLTPDAASTPTPTKPTGIQVIVDYEPEHLRQPIMTPRQVRLNRVKQQFKVRAIFWGYLLGLLSAILIFICGMWMGIVLHQMEILL